MAEGWEDPDDSFFLPDPAAVDNEARERAAIALGQDLYMLTQLQPSWNAFVAWMRQRANNIARASLKSPDQTKTHDYWLGRLEECEDVLADLAHVIAEGEQFRSVHQELAEKVHGGSGD